MGLSVGLIRNNPQMYAMFLYHCLRVKVKLTKIAKRQAEIVSLKSVIAFVVEYIIGLLQK
ncbi:MAG: hypothetical protein EBS86_14325 [Crocinitomicaceae bacterium]|nr:hypothetical protein [Crocinitomicaceae bacterium]